MNRLIFLMLSMLLIVAVKVNAANSMEGGVKEGVYISEDGVSVSYVVSLDVDVGGKQEALLTDIHNFKNSIDPRHERPSFKIPRKAGFRKPRDGIKQKNFNLVVATYT